MHKTLQGRSDNRTLYLLRFRTFVPQELTDAAKYRSGTLDLPNVLASILQRANGQTSAYLDKAVKEVHRNTVNYEDIYILSKATQGEDVNGTETVPSECACRS